MRVFTKKAFKFVRTPGGEFVTTKALNFADLPDWVVNDPMFGWAKSEGSIEVIESRSDELKAERSVTDQTPVEPEEEDEEDEEVEAGDADEEQDEDESSRSPRRLRKNK